MQTFLDDSTRYAQLLQEQRKTAIARTKILWVKGSGRSTLSGKNCGQTSS